MCGGNSTQGGILSGGNYTGQELQGTINFFKNKGVH